MRGPSAKAEVTYDGTSAVEDLPAAYCCMISALVIGYAAL